MNAFGVQRLITRDECCRVILAKNLPNVEVVGNTCDGATEKGNSS